MKGSVERLARVLLHLGKRRKRGNRPLSTTLRQLMAIGPNVAVVAAMRKTAEGAFQFPIQGMYGGANIDDAELRNEYTSGNGACE